MNILQYFARLSGSQQILWCYLIWYAVMVTCYPASDMSLWSTSLGIGLIVGFALMLSTGPVTVERLSRRPWESLRLFLIPFLVSSFAATVTGQGFVLVFSPKLDENLLALAGIVLFLGFVRLLGRLV